ncbi:MAG: hypothetical protein AAGM36_07910 [Cyanobacteria bacterium J06597_1]
MAVTIVRADLDPRKVSPRKLLQAMTRSYGRTYCVPTWYYADYSSGCIYTQHGERWGVGGMTHAWATYAEFIEAIWVRYYNDGDDYDVLSRFSGPGTMKYQPYKRSQNKLRCELCQYGFDEILIGGLEEPSGYLDADWTPTQLGGIWSTRIQGHYLSGNARNDCYSTRKPLTSPTTPINGLIYDKLFEPRSMQTYFRWQAAKLPPELVEIESRIYRDASHVEFKWRGRTTRLYQQYDHRWWEWRMDDWDNCINPGWLAEDPALLAQNSSHLFGRLRTQCSGSPFGWPQDAA